MSVSKAKSRCRGSKGIIECHSDVLIEQRKTQHNQSIVDHPRADTAPF